MILAHGSGIDDLFIFGIPVIAALVALRIAEKRAQARLAAEESIGSETSVEGTSNDPTPG
jgi:hypothetical protein